MSVYNFSAQPRAWFGNQRSLKFGVKAVRDIPLLSRLWKNIHVSSDF